MKFSGLRLSGFKSFPDPTELVIGPGLTGIVGPNGCGKSNLLEALRWVMGETSFKSMRGTGMEDVIFAGSVARPAHSMAEAVLVIDNTDRTATPAFNDSDTIEISRSIERDAGSTYRINGHDVRARDVQLFFADASTGAHSSALVRQGRISELIAAKPADRRRILEEAAGISGLHARRHEAELRLRGAAANLERLNDIIIAAEASLKALQRQMRQARRYRNISSHVRETEAILLHLQWTEACAQAGRHDKDRGAVLEAIAEHVRAAAAAASALAGADEKLAPLREAEVRAAAAMHQRRAAAQGLEAEEQHAREEAGQLAGQEAQIRRDMDREQAQITQARATLKRLQGRKAEMEAARQSPGNGAPGDGGGIGGGGKPGKMKVLAADASRARQRSDDARRSLEAAESALATAQREAAKARDSWHRAGRKADSLAARVQAIRESVAENDGAGWTPLIDLLTVEPGYEAALGAALGDALDAALDETAPAHWKTLPPLDSAAPLPPGATPLINYIAGPDALVRLLSHTGLVATQDSGDDVQKALQPGQQLVSRAGRLWRWDGYAATQTSGAGRRLALRNRLGALTGELHAARTRAAEARDAHAKTQAEAQRTVEACARQKHLLREAEDGAEAARSTLETAGRQTSEQLLRDEIAAWSARAAEAERHIRELQSRRAATKERRTALAAAMADFGTRHEAAMEDAGAARDAHAAASDAFARASTERARLEKDERRFQALLADARTTQARLDALLESAKAHQEDVAGRIRDTLGVAPQDALAQANLKPGTPLSMQQAEARLARLKREREQMGGVNLAAEDDMEAQARRMEDMISERTDLEEAIAKLRRGIARLNAEGRKRLLDAHGAVNANFERLFTHLFNGGAARLELVESDDPLEVGLEIMAQPPGKRLQTMSLLSGGEQALTAMALIFAVFLTNPSPICFLDEVDAPLDDANVERFCNLMDEMTRTSDTRFLIITHHALTMARMRRLLGITMQERGISQLVAVDLETASRQRQAHSGG